MSPFLTRIERPDGFPVFAAAEPSVPGPVIVAVTDSLAVEGVTWVTLINAFGAVVTAFEAITGIRSSVDIVTEVETFPVI